MLFVSSNPSLSAVEEYPTAIWERPGVAPERGEWTPQRLVGFFEGRFDEHAPDRPIAGGNRTRSSDGTYSKPVAFLSAVRNRATEVYRDVLSRPVVPGVDYCITETVHCKSPSEIGVEAAAAVCAERYLEKVLTCAVAPVIVCLGAIAAAALGCRPGSGITHTAVHSVCDAAIGGRPRCVVFLPHPNRIGPPKTLHALAEDDRARLEGALLAHGCA